ncbi:hypothetical protein MA16_Dca011158 [Dendrobium catenatum]|uniref:COX assembly mitochondrial protein n=1 Tax=Dendrobium catenatum TaxID=906689 RepID=A0A2I0WSH9_9ASPA|nr:hypothetical protein MA16_Dca011158 [Dendrobium catenatum]
MSKRGGKPKSSGSASPTSSPAPAKCDALQRALIECHHRIQDELQRSIACRHLNRSLAECLLSASCPEEAEAVRSLCSSEAPPSRDLSAAMPNFPSLSASHLARSPIRKILTLTILLPR